MGSLTTMIQSIASDRTKRQSQQSNALDKNVVMSLLFGLHISGNELQNTLSRRRADSISQRLRAVYTFHWLTKGICAEVN
jgi:hypothetical protein